MSDFVVDIRKIVSIDPHDGADRLELAHVEGLDFQYVVQKDLYKIGEEVICFPLDSLITPEIIELFDLNFLAGKQKNRVKTVKLRGKLSQGLILPLSKFKKAGIFDHALNESVSGDLTEKLGILKWEPTPVMSQGGNLLPLPDGLSVYDIQGYERYPEATARLMELDVIITEKVEGTNISITVNTNGEVFVNQRKHTIQEIESKKKNVYWETARKSQAIEFAKRCLSKIPDAKQLTLYGELLGPGIQKNLYNLPKHIISMYDIKVDGRFLSVFKFLELIERVFATAFDCQLFDLVPVPIITDQGAITLREWLNGRTIEEASTGPSMLGLDLREGIVIRPLEEEYSEELQGRLILKKRSPEYLIKYGM